MPRRIDIINKLVFQVLKFDNIIQLNMACGGYMYYTVIINEVD